MLLNKSTYVNTQKEQEDCRTLSLQQLHKSVFSEASFHNISTWFLLVIRFSIMWVSMYSSTIHTHACIEPSFLSTVIRKFPAFDSGGYFFFQTLSFSDNKYSRNKTAEEATCGQMNTTEKKPLQFFLQALPSHFLGQKK